MNDKLFGSSVSHYSTLVLANTPFSEATAELIFF